MVKSLCASLRVSKLGKMIKHLSFSTLWADPDYHITAKALARLAKLVPPTLKGDVLEQAIQLMYRSEMKRRIDDEMEELVEDYFDEDLEESIRYSAYENVAEHYDIQTDFLISDMVTAEVERCFDSGRT
jgi:hypothetical protein